MQRYQVCYTEEQTETGIPKEGRAQDKHKLIHTQEASTATPSRPSTSRKADLASRVFSKHPEVTQALDYRLTNTTEQRHADPNPCKHTTPSMQHNCYNTGIVNARAATSCL